VAERSFPQSFFPSRRMLWASYATVPKDLKYAKSHEWLKVEGSIGTVGVTDHAQDSLGEVVFVDLPDVGSVFGKKETFGAVESVKTAGDLYMPAGGEVIEINSQLKESGDVTLVNKDPYGQGWMLKVKLANAAVDTSDLLDAKAYEAHCATEGDHH